MSDLAQDSILHICIIHAYLLKYTFTERYLEHCKKSILWEGYMCFEIISSLSCNILTAVIAGLSMQLDIAQAGTTLVKILVWM